MNVDIYLLDNFTFELDKEQYADIFELYTKMAQERILLEKKGYFNFYPQEVHRLQLIVECDRPEKSILNISGLNVHHTSQHVWKMKVINNMSCDNNSYMVNSIDENGSYCIRLVNKDVLGDIKKDTEIEAQVVGMALSVDIFENEKEYEDSVKPSKNGEKYFLEFGCPMTDYLIINNSTNKTKEERENIDHSLDNTMVITGKIKEIYKYDLNMYNVEMNPYYGALIDTKFGELVIFFSRPMLDEKVKGVGKGMIISARILLSGDVAINKYDKYVEKNTLANKK